MIYKTQLQTYDILFGPVKESLSEILNGTTYSKIAILVDENTIHHCLPLIENIVPSAYIIQIQSGEEHKNLETCQRIWLQMKDKYLDRNSLLLNLGGGVIGDMGGFAASCYMRGIDFIQIPTTLLSQVDASVGGKLGVDFMGLKNFIGQFENPKSVLIDIVFLETLPERELRSGYAEMIKHALIADNSFWNEVIKLDHWKEAITLSNIRRSVETKKKVVEADPKEKGLRKILNFGHTIGHAIESLSFQNKLPLLHGEAIAIGMIAEAYLSRKKEKLDKLEMSSIEDYLFSVFGDINLNQIQWKDHVMKIVQSDKKNENNVVLCSLLGKIGNCSYNDPIDERDILEAIQYCSDYLSQKTLQ